MAEQHKKSGGKNRPLFRENAESGGGKKSSVLALAVTCSPPSPAAARTSMLAAPSPVSKARPTATVVAVNTPVAAMPPELAGPDRSIGSPRPAGQPCAIKTLSFHRILIALCLWHIVVQSRSFAPFSLAAHELNNTPSASKQLKVHGLSQIKYHYI